MFVFLIHPSGYAFGFEVSFRRRGVYRKLEETGKSPVSSLYFPLPIAPRFLSVGVIRAKHCAEARCGGRLRCGL